MSPEMKEMVEFAKAWAELGDSVADQAECVLNETDDETNVNPNAIRLAHERLADLSPEVDERLSDWLREWILE